MRGKCQYIPFKNETDSFLESATQLYPCIYFIALTLDFVECHFFSIKVYEF